MKSLDEITDLQLDVFREIANIGAGNAATALATMLNTRMDMSVPNVRIIPFSQVADVMSGAENTIVGIMIMMDEDLQGYIMLVLEVRNAHELASLLLERPFDKDTFGPESIDFDELELSALSEIGNILIGSYISAISSLTGLRIDMSVPDLVVDMAGAILSVPASTYGEIGDGVLFLETQFTGEDHEIGGQFFMIPDLNSYTVLMKSLGVDA